MTKAVILLSAGLDSTVALAKALKEYQVVLALTFAYGQKGQKKEVENSKKTAKFFKIPHLIIALEWYKKLNMQNALIGSKKNLPRLDMEQLQNIKTTTRSAQEVWLPNRNGLFLNVAACYAEKLGADTIVVGFNKEEGLTFPDNTEDYRKAAQKAFAYSTANNVRIKSYLANKNKSQIVKEGLRLNIPWQYVWSCYLGGASLCGKCESCLRLMRALQKEKKPVSFVSKYKNFKNFKEQA